MIHYLRLSPRSNRSPRPAGNTRQSTALEIPQTTFRSCGQNAPGETADAGSGKHRRRAGVLRKLALAAGVTALGWPMMAGHAFPPAPHFTIYGDARDQYGNLIPAGSVSVVLYKGGVETMRVPLTEAAGRDFNYQLRIRIDMLRDSTAAYSSKALSAGTVFTLGIEAGGMVYYPIEMSSPPAVGSPSGRRRLDLTLGVDSDGDGLPDAWEESQLHQAGILAGPNGWDLSLMDKNGDFDGDGVSNLVEYLSGTYAADASSSVDLKIREKLPGTARLEFYGIRGKSYTLQSSVDLKTWSAASFSLTAPGADPAGDSLNSLTATTTGVISLHTAAAPATTCYRLTIR